MAERVNGVEASGPEKRWATRGGKERSVGRARQDVAAGEELERLEGAAVGAEEALAALDKAILVAHLKRTQKGQRGDQ